LSVADVDRLQSALGEAFYFDRDAAIAAVSTERLFNLMHMTSAIKIDLIVRKAASYRRIEFERRQQVNLGGMRVWIVSREDLILSKLDWSRESGSELQQRDVRDLLQGVVDWEYLNRWAEHLGVLSALQSLRP
jgi:predicted nucleotidyltransferase